MTQLNMTGTWTFFGKPVQEGGTSGSGQIEVTLRQHGVDLTGEIIQTIDPWTQAPPDDPESTRASVIGKVYAAASQPATIVEMTRLNHHSAFMAIFTGIVSPDGRNVTGHVVNSRGNLGSFTMHRASGD